MENANSLEKAYWFWCRLLGLERADKQIQSVLQHNAPTESTNWLERCREGLWISQAEMARRLGLTRSSYHHLEQSETRGTATLERLRGAAEAMDCELVYWVRPKKRKVFSRLIWERIEPEALEIYRQRRRMEPFIRPEILSRIARTHVCKTKVRKRNQWVQLESKSTRL